MSVNLSALAGAGQQFFDNNGVILSGGKLYSYAAGTTTPQAAYTSASGATPHTNPIILNSAGRVATGEIWLTAGENYKFSLFTSTDVLIATWDNITGINGTGITTNAATVALTPSGYTTATTVQAGFDNLGSSAGTSKVGFIQAGAGAVSRTAQAKLRESVSVQDFGAVGDGTTDDTVAIQAARDFIAANATRYKLIFPSGIYKYTASPNWAIQDAEIEGQGEVRLRYTGTGNAVILNADGVDAVCFTPGLCYNVQMGRFIVEAPATANNGVFIRSVHHSKFGFNVRGAGTASAGLLVKYAVCNLFENYICSVNEENWYSTTKPAFGLSMESRNPGETVSYCTFINPIIEGPDIGIQSTGSLGNVFLGGTSEACSTYGVFLSSAASGDKFFGTDFEANTVADVFCQGTALELHGVDSNNLIAFGTTAVRCAIFGGQHSSINIDAGAILCSVINAGFNRTDVPGTFTDAGTQTYISNVQNIIGAVRYLTGTLAITPGTIGAGSQGVSTVTVAGTVLGDLPVASYSVSVANLVVTANVTSANTVTVYLTNTSAVGITPGNGTIRVMVTRG